MTTEGIMRRLFAALIVVTVALTLVGCGADEEAATDAPADSETAPAPPAGSGDEADLDDDFSPEVEGFPRSFPTDHRLVPDEIQDRLDAGQPMFIYFYDDEHDVTDDVEDVIESVIAKYRGLIDRIDYPISGDIEDVLETGDFGDDLTDEETDQKKKLYELADELGIGITPFFIVVDRMGEITWMGRGYVDQETLEMRALYATQ